MPASPVVAAEGDQVATVGTEHTLTTQTTAGIYQLVVDIGPLALGEIVELTLKTKVRTGGTSRNAYGPAAFHGGTAEKNVYSVPVPVDVEVVATLKQVNGTGRTFSWKVYRL